MLLNKGELHVASSLYTLMLLLTLPAVNEWRALSDEALRLRMEGRLGEAEVLYRRALGGLARTAGEHHPDYAVALNNLGRVKAAMGDYKSARRWHEQALTRLERALGPDHPLVAKAAANLAEVYQATKQFDRAAVLLERALAGERDEVRLAEHLERLAFAEFKRKRLPEAIAAQERALILRRKLSGEGSVEAAENESNLAALYFHARRFEEAAGRFALAVPALSLHWGPDHPRLLEALEIWEQSLLRLEDFAGAARVEARSTRIRVRAALR